MALENATLQYTGFTIIQKASMITLLDTYPEWMETVHEIKNALNVSGSVVLHVYQAELLARLIEPYWPFITDYILSHNGRKTVCRQSPAEAALEHREIVEKLSG